MLKTSSPNSTVGITGVHGFVGRNLCAYLLAAGFEVVGFGRQEASLLKVHPRYAYRQWTLPDTLPGPKPRLDALVHCAAKVTPEIEDNGHFRVNVEGTRQVVETYPAAHCIYISSGSVYPLAGTDIQEDEPINSKKYLVAYARTKYQAEQVVQAQATRYTILRPHIIYGPQDTTIIPRLLRAQRPSLGRMLVFGSGQNLVSPTAVVNLAQAVERSLRNPQNTIYNVTDGVSATLLELLNELKQAGQITYPYLHLPVWLGSLAAKVLPFLSKDPLLNEYLLHQLTTTHTLSITKAKQELGYHPSVTYQTHLQDYYQV